jgi:hypothetical protein
MRAKTRVVEQEETAVDRKLQLKHLFAVTNSQATIEEMLGP